MTLEPGEAAPAPSADGWTATKAAAFREAFLDFLSVVRVDSKEDGYSVLDLYLAQTMFVDEVLAGLQNGQHDVVCLKARQLGISTVSYLLSIFYASVFEGLQGAVVFDSGGNKEKFRQLFKRALDSLPRSHRLRRARENKDGIVFENGSSLDYLVAGRRKSASSSNLGRSRAYNYLHLTEVSSYVDVEGVISLEKSKAMTAPNRLYISESTAKGLNLFYDLWERAKANPETHRAFFIGWWAKRDYAFEPGSKLYERWAAEGPTEGEQRRIDEVRRLYGVEVSLAQLAWYRWSTNGAAEEGDDGEDSRAAIERQELPWTEDDAWIVTGTEFFSATSLSPLALQAREAPFHGYRYVLGQDFLATELLPVRRYNDAKLKVWEEPDPNGVYIIGCDPAYGSSDSGDRYVAQVCRAYADGLDQVAEFCDVSLLTYQFAWVIAHLAGAYANARLILEINGPGEAVLNELRNLPLLLAQGELRNRAVELGLTSIFSNVRNYVYRRHDSLGGSGGALHWKTNNQLKVDAFQKLRDMVQLGKIRVLSNEAIGEMQHIVQDGPSIEASGARKDDRVMALAMCVRAWRDFEMKSMVAEGRTRFAEREGRVSGPGDLYQAFNESIIKDFFAGRARERAMMMAAARRSRRRW